MKAIRIYHIKQFYEDESFIEVKIWKVPKSEDKPHGLKYSFVYVKGGKRLIGYDNGERKGDHRHYGSSEGPYSYSNIDKLLDDFMNDIAKFRKEARDEG